MTLRGLLLPYASQGFIAPVAPNQNLSKALEQCIPVNAFVLRDGAEDAA